MRRTAPHVAVALSYVLLGAVFLGPGAGHANACSCAESPSPEEELRTADAVFAGEVLSVEENPSGVVGGGLPNVPARFRVEESWKGATEEELTVLGGDGVSCGYGFQDGGRYLVYAHRDGDGTGEALGVTLCGATKPLASAALGPPAVAISGGELAPTGGPPLGGAMAFALFALALAVAGALLRARR